MGVIFLSYCQHFQSFIYSFQFYFFFCNFFSSSSFHFSSFFVLFFLRISYCMYCLLYLKYRRICECPSIFYRYFHASCSSEDENCISGPLLQSLSTHSTIVSRLLKQKLTSISVLSSLFLVGSGDALLCLYFPLPMTCSSLDAMY